MAFTNNDKILVTIGSTKPAPLILYLWEDRIELTSNVLPDLPLEIQARRNEFDNVTVIVMQTKIMEMNIRNDYPQLEEYCRIEDKQKELKQEIITAGTLIHTNETMVKLSSKMNILGVTGHPDGTVVYWTEGRIPAILGNYLYQVSSIKPLADPIGIATVSGHIYLVSFVITVVEYAY